MRDSYTTIIMTWCPKKKPIAITLILSLLSPLTRLSLNIAPTLKRLILLSYTN